MQSLAVFTGWRNIRSRWACGRQHTEDLFCREALVALMLFSREALMGSMLTIGRLCRFEDNVVEPYLRAPKHLDTKLPAS